MKKLIAFALFLTLGLSYSYAQVEKVVEKNEATGPIMTFESTEVDYGTIIQDSDPFRFFKFTNTGDAPLVINHAKGSCGCTVPQWPREPIAPGQTSEITVEFNSKNKKGKQNKKVTITANTNPAQTFVYIKGEVVAAEGAAPVQ